MGIRPEHLILSVPANKNLPLQVELVENLGNDTYLAAKLTDVNFQQTLLANHTVQVRVPPDKSVRLGEQLWFSLTPDKIYFFDPETELAIYPKTSPSLPFENKHS